MKLTVKDVAKRSGLSESTIRVYSWRMKLGTVEAGKKYFTQAEADKMTKAAATQGGEKGKTARKKASKPSVKQKWKPRSKPKDQPREPQIEQPKEPQKKPSFWRFLGLQRK